MDDSRQYGREMDIEWKRKEHGPDFRVIGNFDIVIRGILDDEKVMSMLSDMLKDDALRIVQDIRSSSNNSFTRDENGDVRVSGCICCWGDYYGWCPCGSYTGCSVHPGCPA